MIRLAPFETRMVSPSPTDRTVAAFAGPARSINASKGHRRIIRAWGSGGGGAGGRLLDLDVLKIKDALII